MNTWTATVSIRAFAGSMLFATMSLLFVLIGSIADTGTFELGWFGLFLVTPFLIARVLLARWSARYEIHKGMARSRQGILARATSEIELEHVRNVRVSQSLLGRILDYGNVELSTAGQSGMEIAFRAVDKPEHVAQIVRRGMRLKSAA